jgi:hypothetical protein
MTPTPTPHPIPHTPNIARIIDLKNLKIPPITPLSIFSILATEVDGCPMLNFEKSSLNWQTLEGEQTLALQDPVSVPDDWK